MTSSRKKPGVAFWTTAALLVLPVLYVVSFGPVVWLADRDVVSKHMAAATYSPILGQLRVDDVLWAYGNLGCQDPFTMLHLFVLATVTPSTGELIDMSGG